MEVEMGIAVELGYSEVWWMDVKENEVKEGCGVVVRGNRLVLTDTGSGTISLPLTENVYKKVLPIVVLSKAIDIGPGW